MNVRPIFLLALAAAAGLLLVPQLRALALRTVNGTSLRSFIAREEGEIAWAYDDLTGKPWGISKKGKATIGIGHLILPSEPHLLAYTPANPAPKSLLDELFRRDVVEHSAPVDALGLRLTDRQRTALVSLVYNIGGQSFSGSEVVRQLRAGNFTAAAAAFLHWNTGNGVKGLLTARRQREKDLFLSA